MGLDFCTECLSIEGEWVTNPDGEKVSCGECGAEDSYCDLAEDADLER